MLKIERRTKMDLATTKTKFELETKTRKRKLYNFLPSFTAYLLHTIQFTIFLFLSFFILI